MRKTPIDFEVVTNAIKETGIPVIGKACFFIAQYMKFGITLRYRPGTSPGPKSLKKRALTIGTPYKL